MRFPWWASVDKTELALRFAGVALASGSVAFATHMMGAGDRRPQITGVEHLAIYARPATSKAQRARVDPREKVDFTPVGAIRKDAPEIVLGDFELIGAAPGAATIRTPQGRVARVAPGARLAGVGAVLSIERRGGKWVVATQAGLIRER